MTRTYPAREAPLLMMTDTHELPQVQKERDTMRFTARMRTLAVASALLMGMSACGSGGAAADNQGHAPDASQFDAQMQSLYKKAVNSGHTTIVAYGPPGAINEDVAKDFAQSFPKIKIKFKYLFGADLQSRVAAEYQSGQPTVDVFLSGAIDNDAFREAGHLKPFDPNSAAKLPAKFKEDSWASPIQVVLGPMYNTTKLKRAQVPQHWSDLADPSLKGKVGMSDPTVPATAAFMIGAALREHIVDKSWVAAVGALKPKIFPSQTASVQAVASGQVAMTLLVSYNNFRAAQDKGAPVKFVQLDEGTFAWPQSVALAAKSDASDAAKLFIAWLYTDAGQKSVASIGLQGTMPDAPRPEGLESTKYFTYPHSAVLKEYDTFSKIINRDF